MKTVGLIVEYNPLHNGHLYHFRESKRVAEADAVICVMSGHFLQRGEPAVAGKWARAEMALAMGADVVLELPVAYAAQPAEWFAFGAVSALEATGVVDSLCFGSESGRIDWLDGLAARMAAESEGFRSLLREQLQSGAPYPAAYSRAVARHADGVDAEELAKPNNTLGLHYLMALRRLQSGIRPLTIARHKAGYSDTRASDEHIASATAIRRLLFEERRLDALRPYVPAATFEILRREWDAGRAPVSWDSFAKPLLHQLLCRSAKELAEFGEVTEGLEHRIKQALPRLDPSGPQPVETLLGLLKTKRYTRTKLQRTLLRILLQHRKSALAPERLKAGVPYLRVLGFSPAGRELLKAMKKTASVPVVTKIAAAGGERDDMLQMDIDATAAYALGLPASTARDVFRDYYEPPVQLR